MTTTTSGQKRIALMRQYLEKMTNLLFNRLDFAYSHIPSDGHLLCRCADIDEHSVFLSTAKTPLNEYMYKVLAAKLIEI